MILIISVSFSNVSKRFESHFLAGRSLPSLIIGMFIVYEMCVYKKIWIVLFLLSEVDTQETEAIFLGSLFFPFVHLFSCALGYYACRVSLAIVKQFFIEFHVYLNVSLLNQISQSIRDDTNSRSTYSNKAYLEKITDN